MWSAAAWDAPDGTWAAMRGPALHGGVSGRGGEDGPAQAGPCNGGEQLLGIGVGGMPEGRQRLQKHIVGNFSVDRWGGHVAEQGPL